MQAYDAGKCTYSLQKEANLIKQKYKKQETTAQNMKNQLASCNEIRTTEKTPEQMNARTILPGPSNIISK